MAEPDWRAVATAPVAGCEQQRYENCCCVQGGRRTGGPGLAALVYNADEKYARRVKQLDTQVKMIQFGMIDCGEKPAGAKRSLTRQ